MASHFERSLDHKLGLHARIMPLPGEPLKHPEYSVILEWPQTRKSHAQHSLSVT